MSSEWLCGLVFMTNPTKYNVVGASNLAMTATGVDTLNPTGWGHAATKSKWEEERRALQSDYGDVWWPRKARTTALEWMRSIRPCLIGRDCRGFGRGDFRGFGESPSSTQSPQNPLNPQNPSFHNPLCLNFLFGRKGLSC